jgi:hypothetical protein
MEGDATEGRPDFSKEHSEPRLDISVLCYRGILIERPTSCLSPGFCSQRIFEVNSISLLAEIIDISDCIFILCFVTLLVTGNFEFLCSAGQEM